VRTQTRATRRGGCHHRPAAAGGPWRGAGASHGRSQAGATCAHRGPPQALAGPEPLTDRAQSTLAPAGAPAAAPPAPAAAPAKAAAPGAAVSAYKRPQIKRKPDPNAAPAAAPAAAGARSARGRRCSAVALQGTLTLRLPQRRRRSASQPPEGCWAAYCRACASWTRGAARPASQARRFPLPLPFQRVLTLPPLRRRWREDCGGARGGDAASL
jgi:hypothetical protein